MSETPYPQAVTATDRRELLEQLWIALCQALIGRVSDNDKPLRASTAQVACMFLRDNGFTAEQIRKLSGGPNFDTLARMVHDAQEDSARDGDDHGPTGA